MVTIVGSESVGRERKFQITAEEWEKVKEIRSLCHKVVEVGESLRESDSPGLYGIVGHLDLVLEVMPYCYLPFMDSLKEK